MGWRCLDDPIYKSTFKIGFELLWNVSFILAKKIGTILVPELGEY
jgi:hypothetical protein